ncbi:MAG: ParB N-terminal domain-containing protein [Planctomycetota bacterium]
MNLRDTPLERLKPAPYNPRVSLRPGDPGYERLARSLAEFDLVEPLVWNERTGHVVGGHQRLAILKNDGATSAPCVVVDLDDRRERALNVALNNERVGGDWDPGKLVDLLAELGDVPDFDATLTGFDADELADLVLAPPPESLPDETDEDVSDVVRVALEISPTAWEAVRADLDVLVARHRLTPRITLPDH